MDCTNSSTCSGGAAWQATGQEAFEEKYELPKRKHRLEKKTHFQSKLTKTNVKGSDARLPGAHFACCDGGVSPGEQKIKRNYVRLPGIDVASCDGDASLSGKTKNESDVGCRSGLEHILLAVLATKV